MKNKKKYFQERLLEWNRNENVRDMPWKGEPDPYRIWLSEIILQQTRVEQGTQYYLRFINNFPDISSLAKADETTVFKLWEGLGYYSRCRNLIATARYIHNELDSVFPSTYQGLLSLKGIGPYTAAAIASFAYGLPHAVVDGNVYRVLSRFFGIETAIDSTAGKQEFSKLAAELLFKEDPGAYNQSLMDLGATICKPRSPLCADCPLNAGCTAYKNDIVELLPVKEKKINKRTRWIYYLQAEHNGNTYVRKRSTRDIWEDLYEFIPVETTQQMQTSRPVGLPGIKKALGTKAFELIDISQVYRQQLTHQLIIGQFIRIKLKEPLSLQGYEKMSRMGLELLPFPKFISAYLKDKNVSLNSFKR